MARLTGTIVKIVAVSLAASAQKPAPMTNIEEIQNKNNPRYCVAIRMLLIGCFAYGIHLKMFVYSQSTGKLFNEGGLCIASDCYSGYGPGKNKPAMQHVEGIGPIPEGLWYMTGVEDSPETGRDTIILQAAPGTDTHGRGGSSFRIHGDGIGNPGKASHGCIVARYDVRRVMIASIEGKPEEDSSRKLWVNP